MVEPKPSVPISEAEIQAHLDRILNSETFRRAPSLRQLLQFLVCHAARGGTGAIKESVIGMEVFGRSANFDGRIDNIVRVQVHRLRKLIEAYYADEGRDEGIRVSIPKGSYASQFERRSVPAPPAETTGANVFARPAGNDSRGGSPLPASRPASRPYFVASVLAAVFVAGLATGRLLLPEAHGPAGAGRTAPTPPVAGLWSGVFESGVKVIVSYSNPSFLRTGHGQVFVLYQGPLSAPPGTQIDASSLDPSVDRQFLAKREPLFFSDGWTGTGEAMAINRLTVLSTEFGSALSVLPSHALALDDMRGANVIFLGSPWGNGALAEIGFSSAPFYTDNQGSIHLRDPRPPELSRYRNVTDSRTKEISATYALFSVLPGIGAGRRLVSSAGLSTYGTWAAVDLLTTPTGVAQLSRALNGGASRPLPQYFQAVVRTDIIKGMTANPSIVAARTVTVNLPARAQ